MDFSRQLMHDSAREQYRSPLGAVKTGETVRLSVAIKELYVRNVYLVVLNGPTKSFVEMRPEGDLMWSVELEVTGKPSVMWYWFSIKVDEQTRLYYGAQHGKTSGIGAPDWSEPPAFQLTVYDEEFTTPQWFKHATMYQIFPDRFCKAGEETFLAGTQYHESKGREVHVHSQWNEMPEYRAAQGSKFYQPCDYFGGNLRGIMEKLDYLRELGVTVIYLNPIFEAASNHRYNTSDYLNIDPILGSNEDFAALVEAAREYGIQIMLDGVFSHTGDDSIYFNKKGNYDDLGAYQSKDSPYYNWYRFQEYPTKYKSWWGFDTLPEVDEHQQDWIDFVIQSEDSVIKTWLKRGACGFRLDVADELPDETIAAMREAVKSVDADKVLLGEVWEDATTKQSYGVNRKYALGKGLDTVMNYPLVNALMDFLLYRTDAADLKQFLVGQFSNYPKEMVYSLMNLLSSHDIARIRTVLGTGIDPHDLTREQQARFVISSEQEKKGAQLQRMAAAIQFSMPGVPCIYYGDEQGMNGLLDPFNRGAFVEQDEETFEFYQRLGRLRKNKDALRTGHTVYLNQGSDIIVVARFCLDGEDAFGLPAHTGFFITLVNRSDKPRTAVLDFSIREQLQTIQQAQRFDTLSPERGVCLLSDCVYEINAGLLQVDCPPYGIRILEIE